MMKSGRFLSATLFALCVATPILADEPAASTVVATVNGTEITLGQMIATREALPPQYLELADDVLFNGVLEQLIQQTALAAVGEGTQSALDKLIIENQKRTYLSSIVLDQAAASAVTDEALKAAYDAKYAKAEPAQEYHAAHILVATEEEVKAIKAELDAGGDFAKIATAKSTDKGSAANGGDLGWFGVGMMVKPFEDAVVAMKPGTVSEPIKTDFGWHIIKLSEVRAKAAPKFEEVKDELTGDLRQKAVEDKVKELTEAAKIERKVDGIDPAILKKTELVDQQ